jgi:hypothetical protein
MPDSPARFAAAEPAPAATAIATTAAAAAALWGKECAVPLAYQRAAQDVTPHKATDCVACGVAGAEGSAKDWGRAAARQRRPRGLHSGCCGVGDERPARPQVSAGLEPSPAPLCSAAPNSSMPADSASTAPAETAPSRRWAATARAAATAESCCVTAAEPRATRAKPRRGTSAFTTLWIWSWEGAGFSGSMSGNWMVWAAQAGRAAEGDATGRF